jgi:hypothetical protein
MNPEEKDYQIEDVIDFGVETEDQDDLTPEVTDFEEHPSHEVADDVQSSDTQEEEPTEDVISLHSEQPVQNLDQKETSPSQPRVMRYEDFLKNL